MHHPNVIATDQQSFHMYKEKNEVAITRLHPVHLGHHLSISTFSLNSPLRSNLVYPALFHDLLISITQITPEQNPIIHISSMLETDMNLAKMFFTEEMFQIEYPFIVSFI